MSLHIDHIPTPRISSLTHAANVCTPLCCCLQYNTLNEKLPQYDELHKRLMRSAVIGFSASAISDTCSNSIRVIKTTKQTHSEAVTYPQVLKVSIP